VIHWSWFEVMEMRETACVSHSIKEGPVSIAIIDSVAVSAMEELENIVLHNWILSLSSIHCSCRITRDGITESKDILILFVLQSVSVNIDKTI